MQQNNLRSGRSTSCGCLRRENLVERSTTHGRSGFKKYAAWRSMKERCTNPRYAYWKDYGGRGISYDPAWEHFENFDRDMPDPPEGMTLERANVNGPYNKENCTWASWEAQSQNRRTTKLSMSRARAIRELYAFGRGWTQRRLAEEYGVCWWSVHRVIRNDTWKEF